MRPWIAASSASPADRAGCRSVSRCLISTSSRSRSPSACKRAVELASGGRELVVRLRQGRRTLVQRRLDVRHLLLALLQDGKPIVDGGGRLGDLLLQRGEVSASGGRVGDLPLQRADLTAKGRDPAVEVRPPSRPRRPAAPRARYRGRPRATSLARRSPPPRRAPRREWSETCLPVPSPARPYPNLPPGSGRRREC